MKIMNEILFNFSCTVLTCMLHTISNTHVKFFQNLKIFDVWYTNDMFDIFVTPSGDGINSLTRLSLKSRVAQNIL